MVVKSRAPLRLGLGGGGSDVSPYCEKYGGFILSASISRYAYAILKPHSTHSVRFEASDKRVSEVCALEPHFELRGELMLHRAVYNHMVRKYNSGQPLPLELITSCDAPPGSGLGSSSTLVVAMVSAFVELLNLPLDDYSIALTAFQIERIECGLQGGRQDQYSATFGGINFMEFYAENRVIVNPLRIKRELLCELESSILLYFTGISRESAFIIADQSKNVSSGDQVGLLAMHGIKEEALTMKERLLCGDFAGFVQSIQYGWESKKRSAQSVSNSYIDSIYDKAIEAGALAGKVSGAGGGGFMWFFVPTEKRMNVINTLTEIGGQVSSCHLTQHGTQAWRLR